jgi:hypothetical protein
MQFLPDKSSILLISLDISLKLNKLILESITEVWFLSFNQISFFQINLKFKIVFIFIENNRFWFTYNHSDQRVLFELLYKNNYKQVNQSYYVKLEECLCIESKPRRLVLKSGFNIKNIKRTRSIFGEIDFSKRTTKRSL